MDNSVGRRRTPIDDVQPSGSLFFGLRLILADLRRMFRNDPMQNHEKRRIRNEVLWADASLSLNVGQSLQASDDGSGCQAALETDLGRNNRHNVVGRPTWRADAGHPCREGGGRKRDRVSRHVVEHGHLQSGGFSTRRHDHEDRNDDDEMHYRQRPLSIIHFVRASAAAIQYVGRGISWFLRAHCPPRQMRQAPAVGIVLGRLARRNGVRMLGLRGACETGTTKCRRPFGGSGRRGGCGGIAEPDRQVTTSTCLPGVGTASVLLRQLPEIAGQAARCRRRHLHRP